MSLVPSAPLAELRRGFAAARPVERVCYAVGAGLIASGLAHLIVAAADPRPWDGPLSWRKAVTFGLSFGTTLVAVTWVARSLRLGRRTRVWLLGVFAADCVVEVTGITVQAWRHVPSHFNTETPFDTAIAMSLAVGGAVLLIVLGTLAITAFRGRIDGPPSLRLALQAGFALLLAGLAAGVAMIARGETLINEGHRQEAYDTAGFLKAFHAVSLHAVLVLPALAWVLARTNLSERQRTRLVGGAVAGYVIAAGVVFALTV
jgi:hypothetical protein